MAELEKFFIRYEADTRKMESALKRIEQKTSQTNRKLGRGFRGGADGIRNMTAAAGRLKAALIAAVPIAAIAGLAKLATNAISAADNIAKTADKVGLTTDELQELRFAADQAGVGARTFDMAMQRFSRRIGEAAQGSGELYDTLKQYNIGIIDSTGRTRANVDILGDLAEAIKNAKSEQEALRIAFKAFDSEGAALVNMLRGGRTSLEEMRQKARELGVVMEEGLVRQGEKARSKLDALWAIMKARLNVELVKLAPLILEAADALFKVAKAALEAFVAFSKFLGIIARTKEEQLTRGLDKTEDRIRNIQTALEGTMTTPRMRKRFEAELAELKKRRVRLRQELTENVVGGVTDPFAGLSTPVPKMDRRFRLPPKKSEGGKGGKTFADVIERLKSQNRELEMQASKVGMTEAAWQKYKAVQDAIAFAKQNNIPLSEKQLQQIEAEAAKIGALQEKLTAAQEAAARLANAKQTLVNFGERIGQAFEDSVIAALDRTGSAMEKLKDIGRSLVDDLLRQMLRLSVINPILNNLFKQNRPTISGVGGVLGNLFQGAQGAQGAFASGGPVRGNRVALVGERGPELFVPSTSGRIVSNRDTAKMGGDTYYIDARGADQSAIARLERTIREVNGSIERRAVAATADARIRGVLA